MPHINHRERQLSFKIVYYGPGLSGKTTNLMYIHKALDRDRRGEIVVLDTEEERDTLFRLFPFGIGPRRRLLGPFQHVYGPRASLLRGQQAPDP